MSLQNDAGFNGKLKHIGPAEKKRVTSVPQSEQLARTPKLPIPKEKRTEPSVQIVRWERVESVRELHLGMGVGAWRGKGALHCEGRQVPRRRGGQAKRAFLEEIGESMGR